MRKLISALLTAATLAGCQLETRTYCWDNSYSMVLSKNMKLVNYINDQSEYQFADTARGITLFVLRDSRSCYDSMAAGVHREGLSGYADLITEILHDNSQSLDIRERRDTVINGMQARYTGANMLMDSTEHTYIAMCAYQGTQYYYQVYSMCGALQSAHYSREMAAMVQSLKENIQK